MNLSNSNELAKGLPCQIILSNIYTSLIYQLPEHVLRITMSVLHLITHARCETSLLNQVRTGHRPACAWFLKVAVKQIFHGNNCFLNIIETKPFTALNSRYSLSNLSNR